jgi:hypothetical protein
MMLDRRYPLNSACDANHRDAGDTEAISVMPAGMMPESVAEMAEQ